MKTQNLSEKTLPSSNDSLVSKSTNYSSRKRPSLRRVLSKELKHEEIDGCLFGPNMNHFVYTEQDRPRFIFKSIIDNEKLTELDKEEPKEKKDKKIKFTADKIYEVEDWKEYNKPNSFCYFWIY